MRETMDAILTNPKVAATLLTATSAQSWLDYSAPIIELITKVSSLVLILVMIYFHYQKIRKIKEQRKIQEEVSTAIKDKASAENKVKNLWREVEGNAKKNSSGMIQETRNYNKTL